MFTAYIEQRSQRTIGTWPNQGPDTYFAVQLVPEGQLPLKVLNRKFAQKRGIEIIYCGNGYSNRTGPRSMYHKAYQKAKNICDKVDELRGLLQ